MTAASLCLAIVALYGSDIPRDRACAAAEAIVSVGADPLLVALMVPESGLDNRSVNPRSGACGIGQVLYRRRGWQADTPDQLRAYQRRRCRSVMAGVEAGVRAASKKLGDAVAYCADLGGRPVARRYGTDRCAVAGYVAGKNGVEALGRGEAWILVVTAARMDAADDLRRAMAPARRAGL